MEKYINETLQCYFKDPQFTLEIQKEFQCLTEQLTEQLTQLLPVLYFRKPKSLSCLVIFFTCPF